MDVKTATLFVVIVTISVIVGQELSRYIVSGLHSVIQRKEPKRKPVSESIVVTLSIDGMEQFEADMERAAEAMERLVLASSGLTTGPVTINNSYRCGRQVCEEGKE